MKDIDQMIEHMHCGNRCRRDLEMVETGEPLHIKNRHTPHAWRIAAMVAVMAVVAVALLTTKEPRHDDVMPNVAHSVIPQSIVRQMDETRSLTHVDPPAAAKSTYAYSETKDGVRVYCDNNCNADEVLERMEMVIKTLL